MGQSSATKAYTLIFLSCEKEQVMPIAKIKRSIIFLTGIVVKF